MHIHRLRPISRGIASALFCLIASPAFLHAGFVTWDLPHTISANSDVSVAGTLVVAHNLGTFGNASATLNGVTFTPFPTSAPINTIGNVRISAATNVQGDNFNFGDIDPPFTNLSDAYQTLLQSASYTSGLFPPPAMTLTLSGLTVGTQYQFEWWVNQSTLFSYDPNFPPPPLAMTTATSGSSVTLARQGVSPGSVGQFAIGTFTADVASQVFTFTGSDTKTVVNAFQLRALAAPTIPEPGSCLFALAISGVVLRSLHSRSKVRNPIRPL